MPNIKSSAYLRNNYNEVSTVCHQYDEPVFITRNGVGDLAVMSVEAYDRMMSRLQLYDELLRGIDDVKEGHTRSFDEAMEALRARRSR